MTTPLSLVDSVRAWREAEDESASVETGIACVAAIVAAVSPVAGLPSGAAIVRAAGLLLAAYGEHGTDPDGEATAALLAALANADL